MLQRVSLVAGVTVVAVLTAAPPMLAQDAIRGWGTLRFDTSAYDLPVLALGGQGGAVVVLRSDGRLVVLGQVLTDGPAPPVGLSYTAVAIAPGYSAGFAFALRSDSQITTWGPNGGLPAPALPAGVGYVDMAAGGAHAVARRTDGVAVAWGNNQQGQTALPPVPAGAAVLAAHAGNTHSLLLLSNGTILGCGNPAPATAPPLPAGVTYTALWGGPVHTIARRSDGSFVGWGDNQYGQCNVPPPPSGLTYTTMGLGYWHTVALRSDGALVGFGDNTSGQSSPLPLPAGANVAQIVGGSTFTLVRLGTGEVRSFGNAAAVGPWPRPAAGERWLGAAAGYPTIALTSGGNVLQLWPGLGVVPPLLPGTTYRAVAGASGHSVALRSDGRALAWGSNDRGQCAIPPLPPGMSYLAASASFGRTALLRSDGNAVECGNYGASTIPMPPPGNPYVELDANSFGTILRRSDDSVLVIGGQAASQLVVPVLLPGLRYVQVAMMRHFCAALRSDGQVVLWGSLPYTAPPPLPPGVVYVQVEGDEDVLVLRRSDGTAFALDTGVVNSMEPQVVLLPGESVVEVSAGAYLAAVARIGPTATFVSFASGCAGTRPASRLVPRDTPRIGRTFELTVFDLPLDVAVLVFGWNTLGPIPLAGLGMPGCQQHVAIDAAVVVAGAARQARFLLAIPAAPSLVGATFFNQALVLDPAANAAGLVVSDAARAVVGRP